MDVFCEVKVSGLCHRETPVNNCVIDGCPSIDPQRAKVMKFPAHPDFCYDKKVFVRVREVTFTLVHVGIVDYLKKLPREGSVLIMAKELLQPPSPVTISQSCSF